MSKCPICERRPRQNGPFCPTCDGKIKAERKLRQTPQPVRYLTYRGHVVGLFPNGGDTLRPRLLRRDAEKLPKGKTINLNVYCPGYTREQVKRFKATILTLARV